MGRAVRKARAVTQGHLRGLQEHGLQDTSPAIRPVLGGTKGQGSASARSPARAHTRRWEGLRPNFLCTNKPTTGVSLGSGPVRGGCS